MSRYRFRYIWSTEPKALTSRSHDSFHVWTKDIEAASPLSAINQFHKFVQETKEMASDRRTVLRPMVKVDQYVVLSLHQTYHDASLHRDPSSQPIIESQIDYPKSPNPDLLHLNRGGRNPFATVGEVTKEFDF